MSPRGLPRLGQSVVEAGSRVRLHDDEGEAVFAIVDPAEADASVGRISSESPLGRAMLGRAVGECVVVQAPAGQRAVRIVAIASTDGEVGR